jgi:hypothetical protein
VQDSESVLCDFGVTGDAEGIYLWQKKKKEGKITTRLGSCYAHQQELSGWSIHEKQVIIKGDCPS